MINKLSIKGFKSIRQLDLNCRRVNVFIGEPNTGKTNILEALALRCSKCLKPFRKVFRVDSLPDLFFDQDPTIPIELGFDTGRFLLRSEPEGLVGVYRQSNGSGHQAFRMDTTLSVQENTVAPVDNAFPQQTSYYLFSSEKYPYSDQLGALEPPFGANIANLLYSNKEARQSCARFFQGTGFRLNVDYSERGLKITKEADDVLVSFPYESASETLRRMVFYNLVLETNRDQIIVLDEPEAHAFPPFTKRFAEQIVTDDKGNQFFLTTHSPYMLDSLLSKTPASELNVVLCRMENFETKAYPLNEAQIGKLMEWSMDAFFNFDRLLDEKE